MTRHQPRRPAALPAPAAQINITPLIDVMLVLLILFMVVTPAASNGLDLGLPETRGDGKGSSTPLMVVVDEQGLSLNGQPAAELSELERRLTELLQTRSERTVFVRAAGVSYGALVDVLDAVKAAGAVRIGIVD